MNKVISKVTLLFFAASFAVAQTQTPTSASYRFADQRQPAPSPTPTPTATPTPTPTLTSDPTTSCNAMGIGQGASLSGFVPFPATDAWRQNIANAPVDGNSSSLIGFIGSAGLFPNFGAGQYNGGTIGIPYTVVSGSPFAGVKYTAYGDESDPGPMPIAADAPIEGYP